MIGVVEAKRLVFEAVARTPVERVSLERAQGRVLAEKILADRDFPPTDRSAMDGYAVLASDCAAPRARLRLVGEIRAGCALVADQLLRTGHALRIMTGASLPPGADAVVPVENTELADDGSNVLVHKAVQSGDHVRKRRQDLVRGAVVLESGIMIRPAEIAALASVGATTVAVHALPLVHVLSTGDEIVEASVTPRDHQVRNSNAPALLAQLAELGIEGKYLGIARDERDVAREAIRRGLEGDLLLITGGVSAGAYDWVESSLAEIGVKQLFHHVAMKPGKPLLAGHYGRCLVLGLPGNPLSTFVGFAVFAAPALRRAMGVTNFDEPETQVELAQEFELKVSGRRTYHLARVDLQNGRLSGRRIHATGSGDVLALARANAWLITGEEGGVFPEGTMLPALLWSWPSAR